MSVKEIFALVSVEESLPTIGLVLILLMTLIQITPIKLNPWDKVFKWIGNKLNADLKKDLDAVKKDVNAVKADLDSHIKISMEKDLRDTRMHILEFCNSCMNGHKHTKEQFDFMITQCDDYEKYIEKNEIKNGVITSAINEIRRRYDEAIHNNYF